MEEDEVAGFLSQHLEARPDDQDVYERMIDRLLDGDPHNAVGAVVRIIRARPGDAGRHVAPLMQSAVDHQRLLAAAKQLDAPLGDTAAAWFVRGMLNRRMQRDEAADADFQRALTLDATFKPAAMARIEMLLARGRTDAALELLDGVDTADDPDMQAFRATLLGRIDRTDEALAIIEHLIARNPSNVDYRMRKAALQLRAEQYRDAERTLWSVLDLDPTLESAYASLIRLYNEHLPDNTQYLRLMRRMQKTIPHSRVARLEMTKFHLARRDYDQALSTLRALVKENPEDVAALDMIVQVLAETKRWDEIVELVEQRTEEAPNLPLPLMSVRQAANDLDKMEQFVPLAAAFLTAGEPTVEKQLMLGAIYAEQSRHDEAIAAMEKALTLKDEIDPEVRIQLARLYDEVGRREDALAEIDAALAEHPDEAADIYYAKALLHHREDETDAAEATLLKALEADPDHAPSNNDLGYTWADAGRNLQRAKAMISKAVAARPREAAYLDSLGWVHYKLGEFEEAAARLEEARSLPGGGDPVILDHLGDALWQLGREADAVQRWRAARRSAMAQIQGAGDQLPENALAEYRRVRQTTEAKLKAVQADQPPQLAPVPGPADDEADGGG